MKYPIVRDEKLIWSIDPNAVHHDGLVFLMPEEKRRIDACMTEFYEIQLLLFRKITELEDKPNDGT